MPRARNIKHGFFRNEQLAECSAHARLLFIGLWLLADKEGRLEDRVKRIKSDLFPHENIDCDKLLNELVANGFIVRYEAEGVKCIWIPKFVEHQHPHPKELASRLPCFFTACPGKEPAKTSFPSDVLNADVLNVEPLNPSAAIAAGVEAPQAPAENSAADHPPKAPRKRAAPLPDDARGENLPLPPALDAEKFRETWKEWLAYRRDRRASSRETTLRKQLDYLAPLGPVEAARVLDRSMMNGWIGIFTEKDKPNGRAGDRSRVGAGQHYEGE